jgi:hypothetical protein
MTSQLRNYPVFINSAWTPSRQGLEPKDCSFSFCSCLARALGILQMAGDDDSWDGQSSEVLFLNLNREECRRVLMNDNRYGTEGVHRVIGLLLGTCCGYLQMAGDNLLKFFF